MGHVGQVIDEVKMLREYVKRPGVSTVCEVGFNAGHSAIALLSGQQTKLIEFDKQDLPYSRANRALIERLYPGRTTFHPGRSTHTLPAYVSMFNSTRPMCDLWFIDGRHNAGVPRQDLDNALKVSRKGAIIIMDDCTGRFPDVPKAYWAFVDRGTLTHRAHRSYTLPPPAGRKGWCIGESQGVVHHMMAAEAAKAAPSAGQPVAATQTHAEDRKQSFAQA